MPDRLRNKKKDKAKKTKDLYGNYSAKNVRLFEAQMEKRKEKIPIDKNENEKQLDIKNTNQFLQS
jgi:hypothetical protein